MCPYTISMTILYLLYIVYMYIHYTHPNVLRWLKENSMIAYSMLFIYAHFIIYIVRYGESARKSVQVVGVVIGYVEGAVYDVQSETKLLGK